MSRFATAGYGAEVHRKPLTPTQLAGVLLGKTSPNSLYASQDGCRDCAPVMVVLIRAGTLSVRLCRIKKAVRCREFSARSRPRAGLAPGRGIVPHAKRVGRPPRPAQTASRDDGGAGLGTGATRQDRGADRGQHGRGSMLGLCAAR